MRVKTTADTSKETLGNVKHLQCLNCGEVYSLKRLIEEQGTTMVNVCYGSCLGPLGVVFDTDKLNLSKEEILTRPRTFSCISELLPFEKDDRSFDFPFSELQYSDYFSRKHSLDIFFKLDMNLPSGSFKDRPVLASFRRARETGYEKVFVASTGNLAVSCLKLGRLFGFDVRVYLSDTLNKKRRKYIERFCANPDKQIVTIQGSYDDANIQAIQDSVNENIKDLKDTGQFRTFVPNNSFRPYYKEGSKTSGYEIALQLLYNNISLQKRVHIFYPVGSGALICSAYKGISELRQAGIFPNSVSFYGIQQSNLNPVSSAFKNNTGYKPQKAGEHLVREISIGNPGSGIEALKVLKESGGGAEDVSEYETLETFLELYKNEKIFPQLCGALTLRGFEKISSQRKFTKDDVIVINITGSGKNKIEDDLLHYGNALGFGEEIAKILKGG